MYGGIAREFSLSCGIALEVLMLKSLFSWDLNVPRRVRKVSNRLSWRKVRTKES